MPADLLNDPIALKDLEYQFATSGVYAIYCTYTDTYYIGQATVVLRRVVDHFTMLRSGSHTNDALQKEFDLYKEDDFVVDLIVDMPDASIVELRIRETKEIQRFKAHGKRLYNKVNTSIRLGEPRRSKSSSSGSTGNGGSRPRKASHSEKVKEEELAPATCYDCGLIGHLTEEIFECDDGHNRCQSCIEVYLDNWRIDFSEREQSGSQREAKGEVYRRWLVPKGAPLKANIVMAAKRFADRFGYMPTEVYIHPNMNPPDEYRGIKVKNGGIVSGRYIDILIE